MSCTLVTYWSPMTPAVIAVVGEAVRGAADRVTAAIGGTHPGHVASS
jgi:hypothetical protein